MKKLTMNFKENIQFFIDEIGKNTSLTIKEFYIGKNQFVDAALIYINGLVSKDILDRDILNPLMHHIEDTIFSQNNLMDFICKKYISMASTFVGWDLDKAIIGIKRGKSIILISGFTSYIEIDTSEANYRSITEPVNETVIRGPREGFIESLDTNLSILRRRIKDKSLTVEKFIIGRRSQTDLALVYIKAIADDDVINEIRNRLKAIDVDSVAGIGAIEQYIEAYPYSIFPQTFGTERPDKVQAALVEGRAAIILDNEPFVITAPTIMVEFFQAIEDYNQRSIVSSFVRFMRMLVSFIIITLPAIYLTLIKFNSELLPLKFLVPICQSRQGIVLPPFLEILSMELVVEFLREGGLRLPGKIGQVLSVVGGIIIGDTAIKSKFASPTTLLVVGITVVATFVIPNYDMSIAIRTLRFPMLILSEISGMFGIAVGWFILLVHICAMDSFGVPYFSTTKVSDFKDMFIRSPFWKMNKRPEGIPNKNPTRQTDFRYKWKKDRGKDHE